MVGVVKTSIWHTLRKNCYSKSKTPKTFVSGSSVRNYLLKDPIIDWLQLYYSGKNSVCSSKNSSINSYSTGNIITDKGYIFESEVYKYLSKKYPRDTINLSKTTVFNPLDSKDTIDAINKKYPLIFQGTVYDKHTNIGGVTDIIILGSWLKKLFGTVPKNPDMYYVIDIKWSNITLCADGIHIRNTERIPSYKGQLLIYTFALNSMINQKLCEVAYILAKGYTICSMGITNSITNCFKKLGVIDYANRDKQYINDTQLAIQWLRDVRESGESWDVFESRDTRLLPNMKNKFDTKFHKIKKDIANAIHDPTLIWNVSIKNRSIGLDNGIRGYDHPNCSASTLGITGVNAPIIDDIIAINTNKNINNAVILPKKLSNLVPKVNNNCAEFYIDFETVNSSFLENRRIDILNSKTETRIFMIGVGHLDKGKWVYKSFTMNTFNSISENKIIDSFIKYVESVLKKLLCITPARFYYWSHTEKTMLVKNSENRKNKNKEFIDNIVWVDLLKVFKSEPIVVKGARNYGLKEIATNMYENKLIKTTWGNSNVVGSGLEALISAGKIYGNALSKREKKRVLRNIEKYNEVDCKVLCDIVFYMRSS